MPIGTQLKKLRKHQKLYQYEVADRLSIAQKNVCGIEKQQDLLVSTLRKYIEALGGQIKVLAEFNTGKTFDLTQSIKR